MPRTEVQLPVGGWQWVGSRTERVLVADAPYTGEPVNVIGANEALLRRFAALPQTEAGFLEFANEYGSLGTEHPVSLPEGGSKIPDESLAGWKSRAKYAARVIDLWTRAKRPEGHGLSAFFWSKRLTADIDVLYWQDPAQPKTTAKSFRPSFDFDQRKARGLLAARRFREVALEAVISEIEDSTNEGGGWRVEFTSPTSFGYAVDGLWCQMWHQFALEVSGVREWRDCNHCSAPFYLHLDSYSDGRQRDRSTKKFCTEKCKNDHNNAKKARDREKVR